MMQLVHFVLLFASFFISSSDASVKRPGPIVKIKQGPVKGIELNNDVVAYLGVPFAKPPVGSLRWRPPQPPRSWGNKHVFNASEFGNSCFQFHYEFFTNTSAATGSNSSFDPLLLTNESEDCLTVNVFVPRNCVTKDLPVFFWSYGGGFAEGGTSLPIYNPSNFVQEVKDIIVVTSK
jgi:carboxylesterase type B